MRPSWVGGGRTLAEMGTEMLCGWRGVWGSLCSICRDEICLLLTAQSCLVSGTLVGLPGPWIFLHSQLSLFYGPFLVGPIFVTSSETAHWGVVMIELFCLLLQINSKRPIHTCLCASILWVWPMGLVGHGSSLEKFPPPGYCLQG